MKIVLKIVLSAEDCAEDCTEDWMVFKRDSGDSIKTIYTVPGKQLSLVELLSQYHCLIAETELSLSSRYYFDKAMEVTQKSGQRYLVPVNAKFLSFIGLFGFLDSSLILLVMPGTAVWTQPHPSTYCTRTSCIELYSMYFNAENFAILQAICNIVGTLYKFAAINCAHIVKIYNAACDVGP